jgi:hypothetical protein
MSAEEEQVPTEEVEEVEEEEVEEEVVLSVADALKEVCELRYVEMNKAPVPKF